MNDAARFRLTARCISSPSGQVPADGPSTSARTAEKKIGCRDEAANRTPPPDNLRRQFLHRPHDGFFKRGEPKGTIAPRLHLLKECL